MKKLIAVSLLVILAGSVWAAQPNNIGNVKASKLALDQKTLAQIDALTPDTTGQIMLCIDCVRSAVCVSSGTTNGAWVILVPTGTFAGANFSGYAACQ